MEYRFGPNKPNFTGTDAEWKTLKEQIAWWNEDSSTYPKVVVICPHCGAKNTHTDDGTDSHRACDLMIDKKGKKYIMIVPVILFVDILIHRYSAIYTFGHLKRRF